MTRYLLDTNVDSELRQNQPHAAVVAWLSGLRDEQVFISAVTGGELQSGVERTPRQDPDKAREMKVWLSYLEAAFSFLPMGVACFREWSRLMKDEPSAREADIMIAASARVHRLTVATRNGKDFKHLNVEIVNPFETS